MIRVLFFDIDDTLLSFRGYVKEGLSEGFRRYHLGEYNEKVFHTFQQVNKELWEGIEKGTLDLPGLRKIRFNMVFERLGIDFDGPTFEKFFKDALFDSAILEEGAFETVQELSKYYLLVAASNGPYLQQMNRMTLSGLVPYFSHFFISEKVGYQKPSKGFFDVCFDTLRNNGYEDLLPEETVMIGDSFTSDLSGGSSYGMQCILYDPDNKTKDIECPCPVIHSLPQLIPMLTPLSQVNHPPLKP